MANAGGMDAGVDDRVGSACENVALMSQLLVHAKPAQDSGMLAPNT